MFFAFDRIPARQLLADYMCVTVDDEPSNGQIRSIMMIFHFHDLDDYMSRFRQFVAAVSPPNYFTTSISAHVTSDADVAVYLYRRYDMVWYTCSTAPVPMD